MVKHYLSLLKLIVLIVIVSMAGCSKNSSTPLSPSGQTTQPKGTITGLIRNWVTNEPVPLAKVSIGYDGTVQSTTSDSAGQFSFSGVPAGQYQVAGAGAIFSGSYTVTISMAKYNSSQKDSTKKYRDYYYRTATISFTSLIKGDSSAVDDMVGAMLLNISYLNTTVKGEVVNQNMEPVSGALVSLWDESVNPGVVMAQTSTAADGSYQFINVDNGLTVNIKSISSDGSLQGQLPGNLTLPPNVTTDPLRVEVSAERIMLVPSDDTSPFVIGISPENNFDISPTNLQIVYTFSEPIKQTVYTEVDASTPIGNHTMLDDIVLNFVGMKKTDAAVNFSMQWDPTHSQLTISPQGLVGSARYSLDMTTVFNSGKITDAAGNVLVNNPQIIGDFEVLNFTTSGGSPMPAVPAVSRRYVPGYFGNLDYDGGAVGLEWSYDVNARSYNVYRSVNGSPYQLDANDVYAIQFSENIGSLVVPLGATNPLSAGSVSYKVTAVSKDLVETQASAVVTVTDNVNPRLLNATVAPAGGTNNWIYTLSFSEPLDVSEAEKVSSYSIVNTGTVTFTKTAANYVGYSGGNYVVELSVTTSAALPVGYTIDAVGVIDLAGNAMDQTAHSYTF
ncbi:MAG TPA: carboxypeptidase regulatory-like domain-containing protein [Candidatus Acidoferrales bacterium]|nr:carboxypeptidase regulatory-like domain-containing protein [Candidatus Acidoferrales bacterium]